MDTFQNRHLLIRKWRWGDGSLWHNGRTKTRTIHWDKICRWLHLLCTFRLRLLLLLVDTLGIHVHTTIGVRIHGTLAFLGDGCCPWSGGLALPALGGHAVGLVLIFAIFLGAGVVIIGLLAREELWWLVIVLEVQWWCDAEEFTPGSDGGFELASIWRWDRRWDHLELLVKVIA